MSSADVESNNNSNDNKPAVAPREDIIKTAVKFLQNPHVSKSPLVKSQQFLRSKGLTDQEIQIACERSGAYNVHYFNDKPLLPPSLGVQQLYTPQTTLFMRIRDALQSIALFGGLIYSVYLFYKRFIRRWLFGEEKKKTIEDSISELNKSVTESIHDLRDNLTEVKTQVDEIRSLHGQGSTILQLQDLKSEISSVKGLLLNRKQFPAVGGSTPLVPPSIPAWQLSSVAPGDAELPDTDTKDLLEVGSGSGASETEVATKNSDSSLEIM